MISRTSTSLEQLAVRIQAGDSGAETELIVFMQRGLRFLLARQLGPDGLEDALQNTFVIAIRALRRGALRDEKCVAGFVRVIAQRQIQEEIQRRVKARASDSSDDFPLRSTDASPEDLVYRTQRIELGLRAIKACSARDREILKRFYLLEQSQEQICREMGITETQFRLNKNRAKARFGQLGKELMREKRRPVPSQSGTRWKNESLTGAFVA